MREKEWSDGMVVVTVLSRETHGGSVRDCTAGGTTGQELGLDKARPELSGSSAEAETRAVQDFVRVSDGTRTRDRLDHNP